ncbi:MAG TPA: flagellar basal body rod protein FlgB [Firmicutes bacterium]|nr:flagellar basal body rod protein FlgB [Bacillota bacterium]
MPWDPVTSGVLREIGLGLDWAALRQRAIANNLANVDTPGYKREDVAFPEALRRAQAGGGRPLALAVTAPGHLTPPAEEGWAVVRDTGTTLRNDGNNVDIEAEAAELAKNALYYNALVSRAAGYLASLRYVISEGRR